MDVLDLLQLVIKKGASDLFITAYAPPSLKIDGQVLPVKMSNLKPEICRDLAYSLMSDSQQNQFESDKEANFAVNPEGLGRFRVNVFQQQSTVGFVVRRISTHIPSFEELKLPASILEKILTSASSLPIVVSTVQSPPFTIISGITSFISLPCTKYC